jgi:hypothetical protein
MKPEVFPDIHFPSPEFSQNPFKSVRGPVLRQCGLILIELFKNCNLTKGTIFSSAAEFYGHSFWRSYGISQKFSRKYNREIGKYNVHQQGQNYPCSKRNTFPSSKDNKYLL